MKKHTTLSGSIIADATRKNKERKNITISGSLWKAVKERIGSGVSMSALIEILLSRFMNDFENIKEGEHKKT